MEAEWGSCSQVRFATGILYDSEGNEVLCKCGKPAGNAVLGINAYIARCSDCAGLAEYSANFIYKPSENEK